MKNNCYEEQLNSYCCEMYCVVFSKLVQYSFYHFDAGGKCLLTHFGGGSRSQAAEKKNNLITGMDPYFEHGHHMNTNSVGFGYMRKLFYYFLVDEETLDMHIFEMQEPYNDVWTAGAKAKLAYLFKKSYELSYPLSSSSSSGDLHAHLGPVASASVFRRGNVSDSTHWTRHCHSMVNVSIVPVPVEKTSDDDNALP